MGGLSIWHLIIIAVIVLLLFGPNRIPSIGRSMGEAIRGFKKGLEGEGEIDVTNTQKREQLTSAQTQATGQPTTQTSEKEKS